MYEKRNDLFDVTNGAYDEAEVCELVGTFVLYQHCQKFDKKDSSLNGNDGLVVHTNISRPKSVKTTKTFPALFLQNDLKIVFQYNMQIIDYLGV